MSCTTSGDRIQFNLSMGSVLHVALEEVICWNCAGVLGPPLVRSKFRGHPLIRSISGEERGLGTSVWSG